MPNFKYDILAFRTNFCPIKTNPSGNTVWPQAFGFQKLAIFGIFEVLSAQNVNVACYARNIECDFFCDFQTLWTFLRVPKVPLRSFIL